MVSLQTVFLNNYDLNIFVSILEKIITFFFLITLGTNFFLFNCKRWIFSQEKKINFSFFLYFFVIFLILCFFIKFYVSFTSSEQYYNLNSCINIVFVNSSIFSDTLVLLSLLVTLISWFYLSERFLFKTMFFVLYFFVFIFCTVNMVYQSNLFVMFIFFELIFIPSLFFVYKFGYSKKVEKTISFLVLWTLTGSFLVLGVFSYVYSITKSLELNNLSVFFFSDLEKSFICLLFFIGFGVKMPIWPFHYWLTKVHVEAPTGFSIFLSGFLVKTAFFCFAYTFIIFNNNIANLFCTTVTIWGCVDASIRMWGATDLKRLIAFATIQEMNLIILFLLLNQSSSFRILNIFLLVHGLLSAYLFYLVDNVQKRFHSRNITVLSGLSSVSPRLHILIWVGILIFRGFPIFVKLLIEWEILESLICVYGIYGFVIFFFINFFAVLGFCRIWFTVLYGQPSIALKKSNDVLRKDLYVGYFICFNLLVISVVAMLFIGWSYHKIF